MTDHGKFQGRRFLLERVFFSRLKILGRGITSVKPGDISQDEERAS